MARATCHSHSAYGISVASVSGASTKAEGMTPPVPKFFLGVTYGSPRDVLFKAWTCDCRY